MDPSSTQKIETPTVILYEDGIPQSILVQKCRVIIVEGPRQGDEIVMNTETFTIGAYENNDIIIKDATISGQHCEIKLLPTGYLIRDLDSTNGTLVQNLRITEAFLSHGAEVKVGQSKFIFCPLKETTEIHLSHKTQSGNIIGQSLALRKVFHVLDTYADTDATVMIGGPTGSGKELLAEEVHRLSARREKPFVVVDCTALSQSLIESELFGHVKGAFTGAHEDRVGAFEHANGGTIFLDEIGDMNIDLQPKLLRVLEKREIRRIGSNTVRKLDVRIICATNKHLDRECNSGQFREDLYYRLSVIKIELPPLKSRKEDIPLLTRHFLKHLEGDNFIEGRHDLTYLLSMFQRYDWPGNIRELKNAVERFYHSKDGEIDLIPNSFDGSAAPDSPLDGAGFDVDIPFKEAKGQLIGRFEKEYLVHLLDQNEWNISQAAREACIERAYLQRLVKKYDLKKG